MRFDHPIRVMLDADLVAFLDEESRREGSTRASIIRQAVAARRDRRAAENRENHRQIAALHRRIEEEVARNGVLS